MLETEFLFFQGMKKRIDQRISEGNYDEAAVSMQKCMEYILNSLDKCIIYLTERKSESLWNIKIVRAIRSVTELYSEYFK